MHLQYTSAHWISKMSKDQHPEKLWGGRFSESAEQMFETFSASVHFDQRLYRQDIQGSKAHLAGLEKAGVISAQEAQTLTQGLEQIQKAIEDGSFEWQSALEDVHTNIEVQLVKTVGEVAKKLHTGRSRNDQVATDMRLYVKEQVEVLHAAVVALQTSLVDIADGETRTVMPAFTHLQTAQPVSFAHHILAWFEMLQRDKQRLNAVREQADVLPLGSAACAGTAYPIDRQYLAQLLGFSKISNNSLDAVSDRDFALELCFTCAMIMMHLSRMCEEIILWCSQPFGFITLSDRFCSGSSIMPQKKNPDAAELVRGKSARVIGALTGLLVLMKGQPLAYNRDNQEDKESLFDSLDTTLACLQVMAPMVAAIEIHREKMRAAQALGFTTATDLADHLVAKGTPFRDAHRIVGEAVSKAIESGQTFEQMSAEQIQALHPSLDGDAYKVLSAEYSMDTKNVHGGTAPKQVQKQINAARKSL